MIIFERIKFKNLLSTGNVFTEIVLNNAKNTLIVGKNGSGKTTLLDALTFSLFGKPFRNINKPGMINSINGKECVVELEFSVGGNKHKIIRGMKPNIFEIYINDKLVDQGTKTGDYQEYLENYIIKMNYKTFTQIVILGAASFKPFMQLSPTVRRSVIEDLLDIQIFSTMNIITKQKIQINKEDLEKNRVMYNLTEEKVRVIRKTLNYLEAANDKKYDETLDKITEYQETINTLKLEQEKIPARENTIVELEKNINHSREILLKYQNLHAKTKASLEQTQTELAFFHDNETCPICKQGLGHDLRKDVQDKNKIKIDEYMFSINDIVDKLNLIRNNIIEHETVLKNVNKELSILQNKFIEITHFQERIQELQKTLDKPDISAVILKNTANSFETGMIELKTLDESKLQLLTERQYLEMILSLLKDGGIKTKIIKQYLPLINKYINQYLGVMDFYINFNINENFEEIIKSRFRDEFVYDNFSEGEKKRIDLAILFAWRTIARLKNSVNTNLLIFDETFDSSLDGDGTDEFMKILNGLTSDNNTFIISHKKDQLLDKFEKIIHFIKTKDFSRIAE